MNCPHDDHGWCLACVKELHHKYQTSLTRKHELDAGEWSYLRHAVIDAINADALGGKTELVQALFNEAENARADANFAHVEGTNAGIDMAYGNMVRNFTANVAGRVVRGRAVGSVEILIEHSPTDPQPRYFVHLVFTEKQYAPTMSKEERLPHVVMDESPRHAWRMFTVGDFMALLAGMDGIEKYEWALEDEPAIG
jgi:hypothetical protein